MMALQFIWRFKSAFLFAALALTIYFQRDYYDHEIAMAAKRYSDYVNQMAAQRATAEAIESAETARLQHAVSEAQQQYQSDIDGMARAVEGLRRDRDATVADASRLRAQLSAYAAGPVATDSIDACRVRAGRLGELLAEGSEHLSECVSVATDLAADAEANAAAVRALQAAWPVQAP